MSNKNILITGTNKGIGKAIKDKLKKDFDIFKVSKSFSQEENFIQCDLSKKEDINNLIYDNIIFDTIILNAGIGYYGEFESKKIEDYEEIIKLNLLSPIRLLKHLEKNINKNTKIIFIGSISAKKFMKNGSVYIASKFGLRGFAGGLKKEGKKVFIINPKIVNTDFHKGKISLPKNVKYTEINDITNIVLNIINGRENKFEIDL